MSGIQSLRSLLACMNPEEISTFRNMLTSFDSRGEKFESKSVKLLDLLTRPREPIADREIEFLIYGRKATAAYSRLLIRFRDKLLESLLLDINIKRGGAYSMQFRQLFEVRKRISYAQILVGRGLHETALLVYESAVETSMLYEFYEELLTALRLKMQVVSLTRGQQEFQHLQRQYKKYEGCRQAAYNAYCDYNTLIGNTDFKGRQEEHSAFLIRSIARMRLDYEKTGSANVAFYLYYLETHHYQELRFYRHARKSMLRLSALIEKSPAIYAAYRLGNVLINQAENDLFLRQFERSVTTCQQARALLMPGSFNDYLCTEVEFYGHYYAGHYDTALLLLKDLLRNDQGKDASFRRGRRTYLMACTQFMLGNYREVQEILLEQNEVESDREGWNVGIRILSIMNDIERMLHDMAGKKIENARKHLRKLDTQEKLRKRDSLIYEILRELENRSYDFKAVYHTLSDHFENLKSADRDYCWLVRSPELIIFHDWFFAHVIRTRYVQRIPKYSDPRNLPVPLDSEVVPGSNKEI